MSAQSWKSGKAISPFLSDRVTYIYIYIYTILTDIGYEREMGMGDETRTVVVKK